MDNNKMRDISREHFQKWHSTKHGWPLSNYEFYWSDNYYEDEDFQLAWDAWQASREAVVIDLSKAMITGGGYFEDQDAIAAIEAQGLRVTP